MLTALAIAVAYLIGSVDFGVIVPRILGIDIYEHGSGNPGTSNVFRTLGKKPAAMVLVGDLVKGIAAAAVGDLLVSDTVGFVCGVAAVIGHAFPVWHKFRGGRGVATVIGATLWLQWPVGLTAAVVWLGIVLTTKVASVASLLAMALIVPGLILVGEVFVNVVLGGVMAVIVVLRHADNIKRLWNRSEKVITG